MKIKKIDFAIDQLKKLYSIKQFATDKKNILPQKKRYYLIVSSKYFISKLSISIKKKKLKHIDLCIIETFLDYNYTILRS